jgi:hypothetical protein
MRPFVGPPLSAEEFVSLQELWKGVMQSAIPAEHEEKLIKLGYAKKLPDGLRLTKYWQNATCGWTMTDKQPKRPIETPTSLLNRSSI